MHVNAGKRAVSHTMNVDKKLSQIDVKREHRMSPALTGCTDRMQSLPHINISDVSKHVSDHIPQLMEPNPECAADGRIHEMLQDIVKGGGNRKCVYNYEDKYSFARILVSDSLIFDSHFESGNLYSAFRVFPDAPYSILPGERRHIYDLYMHNDINTTSHTQWFYFAVSNVKAGTKVTFNFKNYSKPDSMFNEGMRPLLYSVKSNKGWIRTGTDICYFYSASSDLDNSQQEQQPTGRSNPEMGKFTKGNVDTKKKKGGGCNYTLSFTHEFGYNDDVCYFAYCHPYTYTDLKLHLRRLRENSATSLHFRSSMLCRTLAGNACDVVTITAPSKSQEELKRRTAVILTARVHPGETNASWIMHGILNFLTSSCKEAQQLRELYVIKIVPMLNPDGVINGNYRTSLSGHDLNRRWSNPDPQLHPTIYHTKELIKHMKKKYTLGLVLDIHGHSRKHGVFTYGCVPDRKIMKPLITLSAIARQFVNNPVVDLDDKDGLLGENLAIMEAISKLSLPGVKTTATNSTNTNVKKAEELSEKTNNMSSMSNEDMTKDGGNNAEKYGSNDATTTGSTATGTKNDTSGVHDVEDFMPTSGKLAPGAVGSLADPDTCSLDFLGPTVITNPRDVMAWRVKLLPRIIGATISLFSLDNCSFKMQRGKSSTMRMVAFTELGIDCCYTIEASLAGKKPYHFSIQNLMDIGKNICCSLLKAYPSLAPKCMSKVNPSVFREEPESVRSLLAQFDKEMKSWTPLYNVERCAGSGAALLSENGYNEMTGGVVEDDRKDSDEEPAEEGNNDSASTVEKGKNRKEKREKSKSIKVSKAVKKSNKGPALAVSVYSKEGDIITVEKIGGDGSVETKKKTRSKKVSDPPAPIISPNIKNNMVMDKKSGKAASSKPTRSIINDLGGDILTTRKFSTVESNGNSNIKHGMFDPSVLVVAPSLSMKQINAKRPSVKQSCSNEQNTINGNGNKKHGQLMMAGMLIGHGSGAPSRASVSTEYERLGMLTGDSIDMEKRRVKSLKTKGMEQNRATKAGSGGVSDKAIKLKIENVSSPIRARSQEQNHRSASKDGADLMASLTARSALMPSPGSPEGKLRRERFGSDPNLFDKRGADK